MCPKGNVPNGQKGIIMEEKYLDKMRELKFNRENEFIEKEQENKKGSKRKIPWSYRI